jgi:outer membrane usher protein
MRCSLLIPVVLWSLLALSPVRSWAAQAQRAIFGLSVNLIDKGEIFVILRDGDVLARISDLDQAGLHGLTGTQEVFGGESYVSLTSLAPTITYELDEATLTLRLTVSPALLPPTVLNLRADRPPGLTYLQNPSAFVNYALNWSDFERFDAFSEAGISVAGNLLAGSFTRTAEGEFIRGYTSLTLDQRDSLRRWVIGDHFIGTGLLGGGAFLGGISVSRDFSLDPYLFRYPSLGFAGALLTPSTVDVYVNGILLRREQLRPGPFELRNLPVVSGSGFTQVVIRDAFGREQAITQPYYFSTGLLAPGLSEYSYNLGFERRQSGRESWDYGALVFLGRHRLGLTENLTAGFRLEGSSERLSGGPSATIRLPIGEVDVEAAGSVARGKSGAAAFLGYSYLGRAIGVSAFAQLTSDRYATVGLDPRDDRALLEAGGSVSVPLGPRLSLSLQYSGVDFRDRGWTHRIGLLSSLRLTGRASLFVSANYFPGHQEGPENEFFAGVTYAFGRGITGSVFHQHSGDQSSTAMQVQKSPPLGPGFGYLVEGQLGEQNRGSGVFRYQGDYGIYEASYGRFGDEDATTLSTFGSIVAIGGRVYPTRPIYDSFALIQVPGVAGVPGYISNQEVGRTNRWGDLVVPNLLSYYGNRVGIGAADVPLDYAIDATEKVIAPPYRGGALVTFPVRQTQSFTGTLVVETAGRRVIPAYGQLTVMADGGPIVSPLGKGGEFYLENLPAGTWHAKAEYKAGVCTFMLEIPVTDGPFVNLGTLRCVVP